MKWTDVMTMTEDEILGEIGMVKADVGEVVVGEVENGRTREIDDAEGARHVAFDWRLSSKGHTCTI